MSVKSFNNQFVAIMFSCLMGLSACSDKQEQAQEVTTDEALFTNPYATNLPANAPKLLVATDASYPPFEFRDEKGLVVGFDIDLFTAVAATQGYRVEFLPQGWEGIFDSLNDGARDVVVSSVWITEERKEILEMSDAYFTSSVVLYGKKKDGSMSVVPSGLSNIMKSKISLQGGGTATEGLYDEYLKGRGNERVVTTTSYLAFRELLADRVDYVFDSQALLDYYSSTIKDVTFYKIKDSRVPQWKWGYALKKGNTALLDKLNAGIREVRTNGTYAEIHDKWFGQE